VALLQAHAVDTIADVRTIAKSRHNPQFGQDLLALGLASHGIGYLRLEALGGLRHGARDSINGAWRNASFRGYADYMQTPEFAEGIAELLASADRQLTAIMCAEAVPWRCHRSLIADAVLARGAAVEDIFVSPNGGNSRKPHLLTSFARAENGRVWYPAEAGAEQAELF